MIEYIEGDIFESPAQVIVNTVNTVGVMGKGLALSFKQRYPEMFERYKTACEKHLLTIGKLMLFYEADHWLLLFPTKENWRNPSKLEYIEKGLMKFVQTYAEKNITSIAFPRLGCGNGELDWNDVKPLMERYLKNLPIDVYIYLGNNPDIVPEHKEYKKTISWLKENAKDMSFNGVKDDLTYLSSILPYPFEVNKKQYEMKYCEDKLHIVAVGTDSVWEIEENLLYSIWDDIRVRSVFSENGANEVERIVYGLLHFAGYLSKIKLFNSKLNQMEDGYQINAGRGRVLAFKEV
ncbi:MAG: macro domain-containing protein [Clostridia bacterium]